MVRDGTHMRESRDLPFITFRGFAAARDAELYCLFLERSTAIIL